MISFSVYKSFVAVYIAVGVVCGAAYIVAVSLLHGKEIICFVIFFAVLLVTICILSKIATKKFQKEIVSYMHNCNVGFFMQELTALLGAKRDKSMQSLYACFSAIGYEILGDYDSLYASCQNIKLKVQMPIYHRRMFTYYLHRNELDNAKDELSTLRSLSAKQKKRAEKKVIDDSIAECERALMIRNGEYEEPLKYYSEMIKSTEPEPLLTRVNRAYVYGELLYLTGEEEKAKEPLLFASSRGGDTIYKKTADKILEKINGNKEN